MQDQPQKSGEPGLDESASGVRKRVASCGHRSEDRAAESKATCQKDETDGLLSGATGDGVDAEAEAKAFFASLTVRDYEDIFDTDLIPRIISGRSKRVVPLSRYMKAAGFVFGIVLNVINITSQFRRSIPSQLELLARWQSGQWALSCLVAELEPSAASCQHADADAHSFFRLLLAWSELAMVAFSVVFSILGFCQLRKARTDISSVENSNRWGLIANGFSWLESLPSASAIKILPRLKTLPMEAINSYKLMKGELTEDDGVYSASDRFYAVTFLALPFLRILVVGFAGIFALHLKMESLAFLHALPIGQWNRRYWLTFVGFANQVSGLVPFAALKKEALLFFIFTGEDAEMNVTEYRAMHKFNAMLYKTIFKTCGTLRGFIVGVTISNIDLQKIVITERARESHAKKS